MGSVGVIGLHMVSGPLVGFGIGYGLDYWLDSGPWGKLIFLIIGIGAGFLNVYRDSRQLLRRMAREEARRRAAGEGGEAGAGQTPDIPRAGQDAADATAARDPEDRAAPGHGAPHA